MHMQMILTRLKLEVITLLVSFTCELGKVTTRYDFQWVGQIVWTETNFNIVNFSCKLGLAIGSSAIGAGEDNEVKLMTKHRNNNPVIRSPTQYPGLPLLPL